MQLPLIENDGEGWRDGGTLECRIGGWRRKGNDNPLLALMH